MKNFFKFLNIEFSLTFTLISFIPITIYACFKSNKIFCRENKFLKFLKGFASATNVFKCIFPSKFTFQYFEM